MKITYNGREYDLTEVVNALEQASGEQREKLDELLREGEITSDGSPVVDPARKRLLARLLGTYDYLPVAGFRRPRGQDQWLIPGLWRWGTKPMLGGNPKAGKTAVVADLAAALVVPGYRFLGHFDPVQAKINRDWYDGTDNPKTIASVYDDQTGGVYVINAETPADAFEAAIERGLGGPVDSGYGLIVDHLEELGGAQAMDLMNPDVYDGWVYRLADCKDCDGRDDVMPTTVIIDGLTAVLAAAGKGPEGYGLWFAAFKRLLNECEIPNGLVTAHNTMRGDHLMGGVEAGAGPDGLWSYSSVNPDDPRSVRRFSVVPRLGGVAVPRIEVVLGSDGRPVVGKRPKAAERVPERDCSAGSAAGDDHGVEIDLGAEADAADRPPAAAADREARSGQQAPSPDEVLAVAERVRDYVKENPGADGNRIAADVDGCSWKDLALRARREAKARGWVREEPCGRDCRICDRPHHLRRHFWPVNG